MFFKNSNPARLQENTFKVNFEFNSQRNQWHGRLADGTNPHTLFVLHKDEVLQPNRPGTYSCLLGSQEIGHNVRAVRLAVALDPRDKHTVEFIKDPEYGDYVGKIRSRRLNHLRCLISDRTRFQPRCNGVYLCHLEWDLVGNNEVEMNIIGVRFNTAPTVMIPPQIPEFEEAENFLGKFPEHREDVETAETEQFPIVSKETKETLEKITQEFKEGLKLKGSAMAAAAAALGSVSFKTPVSSSASAVINQDKIDQKALPATEEAAVPLAAEPSASKCVKKTRLAKKSQGVSISLKAPKGDLPAWAKKTKTKLEKKQEDNI